MSKIWVKGATDTSELECEICGNWLDHWKKLSGIGNSKDVFCCHPEHKERRAPRLADRGAHVVKMHSPEGEKELSSTTWEDIEDTMDTESETMFIIPVCKHHNITDTTCIEIDRNILASADPCEE